MPTRLAAAVIALVTAASSALAGGCAVLSPADPPRTLRPAGDPTLGSDRAPTPLPADARRVALPKPDYRYRFTKDAGEDDFNRVYRGVWNPYRNGEGKGKYFWTISAHDGVMDVRLPGGDTSGPGAAGWFGPNDLEAGAVTSITLKVVPGQGYGMSVMMWPTGNEPRRGEKNWPEARFVQSPLAHDHATGARCKTDLNCPDVDSFWPAVDWTQWHTYTIMTSTTGTRYLFDGVEVGSVVRDPIVGPHRYTLQVAGWKNSFPGHVLVREVAITR
ncbi:hypothetical protein FHX74_003242 [Friedmanniella endophytica]|uniref:Glycosyl hydrolases family 16 n=1 Tax=Microlunatus kandeliicorticis TaxID=1759536 RepID=A0A7W3IUN7_9ACTN|nr:hypothetical protein [Microlunatus kandeliicorticis]MBA8795606.1 hypothetical protein [Microlunatus kandeliicorticis]